MRPPHPLALIVLLGAVWGALLGGCSRRDAPPPSTAAISITDDVGRAVRLAGPARRVVSLAPSHTELVFALGAGDRLVGRTPACDFPPAAAAVPPVGNLFPPAYERIVGATPDLVLMTDGSVDVRHRLEKQGLVVAVVHPRTLADVAGAMRTIGALLGVEAAPVAARFEAALAEASRPGGADAPGVFYEIGFDPLYGAGREGFVGDLIRRAGGQSPLPGEWPALSTEQLVAADPALIVVGSAARAEAIRARAPAGWSAIAAVKAGRVVAVPDPDLFVRPGPRVVEGLRWLAAELRRGAPAPK